MGSVSWVTWVCGVLHCNHEHRGSRQIYIGWDTSFPSSGAHYTRARERKGKDDASLKGSVSGLFKVLMKIGLCDL